MRNPATTQDTKHNINYQTPPMVKKKADKKPKKEKKKTPGIFGTITGGRLLSLELFKRHGWLILIALVIVIAMIGQRYTNQTKMEEIKSLHKELELQQSIQLNEKAEYMSLIRENEMRRLLREQHLDLDYQEQPPYVIPRD